VILPGLLIVGVSIGVSDSSLDAFHGNRPMCWSTNILHACIGSPESRKRFTVTFKFADTGPLNLRLFESVIC